MVNGIRIIYLDGLNKGFSLKFCVGSWVWHETAEEDWRTHLLKSDYKNKDEHNSLNMLNDKNYQASSQKFRQIKYKTYNRISH